MTFQKRDDIFSKEKTKICIKSYLFITNSLIFFDNPLISFNFQNEWLVLLNPLMSFFTVFSANGTPKPVISWLVMGFSAYGKVRTKRAGTFERAILLIKYDYIRYNLVELSGYCEHSKRPPSTLH